MKPIIAIIAFATSFSALAGQYQVTSFPEINVNKVHDQDALSEKLGNAPRFAIERKVSINPKLSTNWEKSGNFITWKHRVIATNAVSLNFAFDFKLSENSKLIIYSSNLNEIIRTFTADDNNKDNQLWTPILMSSDVTIELTLPSSELDETLLNLFQVNQGYRTFSQSTEKSGSCNVDVACDESKGWEKEVNSVGVISTGGSTFCTGFMVNNTANDKTPYFMTAQHCRIKSSNAASLVVYWNYQSSDCGGRRDGKKKQFNTGSQWLSDSSKSDFTLVKLNKHPDAAWNVNYAGWDRSGEDAQSAVAIHHPATDEKSISFENEATTTTSYLKNSIPGDGTHVRVENWDIGTTEPGSSGSPLFDDNHRVIGQLHGGYASCSSQTSDWYGRIHTSWEGDGTSNSRLKDWLDAKGSGELTTDTI